jgi:phosphoribosylaminoimidazolecarboxamide formyltransferase/IMP cyclohydrolase
MTKKIQSALISVFYKDGLEPIVRVLNELGVTIYSTGGTQQYIEKLGIKVTPVEDLTGYPAILGGRVKTLHPVVFGGILGRRENDIDVQEMKQFKIPGIDLVIVDLYPFEETVKEYSSKADQGEAPIIEKIDIGGPSMIRGAAKNFRHVLVVAAKKEYHSLEKLLREHKGETTIEQRRSFAARAFEIVAHYDVAIAKYFNPENALHFLESVADPKPLRYGENPHQQAVFYGRLEEYFTQLNGKEISYNNLVDIDAAVQLINEFNDTTFAIIKHTNPCGIASRKTVKESWDAALAGDPESAFGGVLVTNKTLDRETAEGINDLFFEVLVAPSYDPEALEILKSKKNRIVLKQEKQLRPVEQYKSLLDGVLIQATDAGSYLEWKEVGGRETTPAEKEDLKFSNLVCKHLKSNAIALVKNRQLVGKGCGQTSRIDSLRHALEKAKQFNFDLKGAVMAYIQPGGSIRDKDSIDYCVENGLAMVLTGMRHFKH